MQFCAHNNEVPAKDRLSMLTFFLYLDAALTGTLEQIILIGMHMTFRFQSGALNTMRLLIQAHLYLIVSSSQNTYSK